jgi:hypothetical protein
LILRHFLYYTEKVIREASPGWLTLSILPIPLPIQLQRAQCAYQFRGDWQPWGGGGNTKSREAVCITGKRVLISQNKGALICAYPGCQKFRHLKGRGKRHRFCEKHEGVARARGKNGALVRFDEKF